MSGTLFFDILLQPGGILDPPSVYPPEDAHALKNLLDAIENASYDDMKRNCLIYYLLKQGQDGRETGYVSEKMISPHYVAIADAYWFLDMGLKLDVRDTFIVSGVIECFLILSQIARFV